jgi:hypothetical protein
VVVISQARPFCQRSTTTDYRPSTANGKASQEVLPLRGSGEFLNEHPIRLVFLFFGGFLLGCHEVISSVWNDFSPKAQQGTLMPGLLNN